MYKDITASLVAATRKVVEASSAKAANEAAQKEQSSNLSKSMRPAYEGSAPRNAQEISLLREKAHTIPKTSKEKDLAALAEPKDKITHADVMTGRGVKKEEMSSKEKMKKGLYNKEEMSSKDKEPMKKTSAFDYKSPRRPQDAPNRKSGDVTSTGHDVKKISTGTVYTKRFEENEVEAETIAELSIGTLTKVKHAARRAADDATRDGDDAKADKRYDLAGKASNKAEMKYRALGLKPSGQHTMEEVEQMDEAPVDGVAAGSMEGDKHMCASKVMHKEWKEGKTLFSQHAEPNEIGLIEWYDVMFDHGIEKQVPTRDLEIMVSESHMSHSKKKKM